MVVVAVVSVAIVEIMGTAVVVVVDVAAKGLLWGIAYMIIGHIQ
jgi:hypothetical protein